METFSYIVQDKQGIHTRPAGLLVNEAKRFASRITLACGDKEAEGSKLFAVMALGVKHGQQLEVTVDGPDEAEAMQAIKDFLQSNL